jgi:hypothetical protein
VARLLPLISTLAFIALVVGPIGYAANSTDGLSAGLILGLILGLSRGLGGGLIAGLVGGLGLGLGAGFARGFRAWLGWGFGGGLGGGLIAGLGVGLIAGLITGLTVGLTGGLPVKLLAESGWEPGRILRAWLIAGLGAGLVAVPGVGLGTGLGLGLGIGLGAGLGLGFGVLLRPRLQIAFTDAPDLWPYLSLMGRPMLGYTSGYATLVVWFAFVYAALYRWSGHLAFSIPFTPHFGDFLFFAITIFPPIGAYSDLKPLAPWAQSVVAGELIMGVGYTSVIFAAIISYLTPKLGRLFKDPTQEQIYTDLRDLNQRMAHIENQLEKLTEQRTNADTPSANRQKRQHN